MQITIGLLYSFFFVELFLLCCRYQRKNKKAVLPSLSVSLRCIICLILCLYDISLSHLSETLNCIELCGVCSNTISVDRHFYKKNYCKEQLWDHVQHLTRRNKVKELYCLYKTNFSSVQTSPFWTFPNTNREKNDVLIIGFNSTLLCILV